jgi:AraC family cel operon transcriptional repressor
MRRDYVEIVAVKGGRGRLRTFTAGGEARRHELRPGRVFLFRPADDVQYFQSDPDGVGTVYVAFPVADWATFAGFAGVAGAMAALEPPTVEVDPGDPRLFEPFDRAIRRFQDAPTWLDLVAFWTDIVPVLFPVRDRGGSRSSAPAWLTAALAQMADEPNLRRGAARLAELAHVSPSHLAATTRRHLARTPTALVADLRLRHAARLLEGSDEPVAEIARRCGYGDVAAFGAAFRATHGLSPREYRLRDMGAAR